MRRSVKAEEGSRKSVVITLFGLLTSVFGLLTDMDALPLQEKTGLPFASTVVMENSDGQQMPVMHACGHDMHMTVWLGTAQVMSELKDQWKGTLIKTNS